MRSLAVCVAALAVSAGSAAAALPQCGRLRAGTLARRHPRSARARPPCAPRSAGRTASARAARTTTWYFTYKRFDQHGLAVELTRGRVSAVYTLWQPRGWHAANGLRLGVAEGQLDERRRGPLVPVVCSGYDARVADSATVRSVYYVAQGKLWGFGLLRAARGPVPVIELADVQAAAQRLHGVAHRTPVCTSRTLDGLAGASVLREGGVLPARRRVQVPRRVQQDRVARPTNERARGVLAYSSGNHAQAVAIAARLLGTTATIVMPEDAPAAKLEATRGYGAEIVMYDRFADDREEIGARLAAERGLALVKPYDDPLVMAGQGTVALELLVEVPELDLLVTPVGGGGLIAGCATVAKALHPQLRVAGVEPEAGNDTAQSLASGARVNVGVPRTIADGLQAAEPGELTFAINRELVDEIVTVSDEEIVEAMAFLFDRMKLVVEPSGAVGVAALLNGRLRGTTVGVVISGGNVGAQRFAELVGGR